MQMQRHNGDCEGKRYVEAEPGVQVRHSGLRHRTWRPGRRSPQLIAGSRTIDPAHLGTPQHAEPSRCVWVKLRLVLYVGS